MIVTLCSTDIVWEDKTANFKKLDALFSKFDFETEVVVLPEMFATGFTMNTALAEPMEGETVAWLKEKAAALNSALVASFPAVKTENIPAAGKDRKAQSVVNRAVFVEPSGKISYYDKRHLFRMGVENNYYTAGYEKCIVRYKGVNFALNICYDLRFPVWSRNINNEYDVLVNVANFPASRTTVIEPLVRARAIENQSYVIFVNRIGEDILCNYAESSLAADFKGELTGGIKNVNGLERIMPGGAIKQVCIDMAALEHFRRKFPAWQDADEFSLF